MYAVCVRYKLGGPGMPDPLPTFLMITAARDQQVTSGNLTTVPVWTGNCTAQTDPQPRTLPEKHSPLLARCVHWLCWTGPVEDFRIDKGSLDDILTKCAHIYS